MAAPPATLDKIPLDKDLPSFYPISPACTLSAGAPKRGRLAPFHFRTPGHVGYNRHRCGSAGASRSAESPNKWYPNGQRK